MAGLATMTGLAVTGCSGAPPNPVRSAPPAKHSPSPSARAVSSSRPLAPLTGLPAASAAAAASPAVGLVVSGASPQGLDSADVVFEEISSPVRYIAVYQSMQAARVGPITSTQPTDRAALDVLHPLIGYSGAAAAYFVTSMDKTKITDAGYTRHPSLYASGAAGLTTSAQVIRQAVTGDTAPPPLFQYRGAGAGSLAGSGVSRPASVTLAITGLGVQHWSFDAHSDRWTLSGGGPSVHVANLIVQTVSYKRITVSRRHGVTVSAATVTGSGRAEIFSGGAGGTGGTAATGTWSKPHIRDVTNYFDSTGAPMNLLPGPTWIILAPAGTTVTAGGASG